jgi:hypothetical protein
MRRMPPAARQDDDLLEVSALDAAHDRSPRLAADDRRAQTRALVRMNIRDRTGF